MKVNYGSGERKLEGFINIDTEPLTKPDLICDLTKNKFPFEDNSIEAIYCIHNIEHISMHHWVDVFGEFRRVLEPDGLLLLAYPEFEVCVKYFLENYKGQKVFWRACLYGRQNYPGDYHVAPIITGEFAECLRQFGFHNINHRPDDDAPYYTFLSCHKGTPYTREDVLKKEIFGETHAVANRFSFYSPAV